MSAIRRATMQDVEAVARLFRDTRQTSLPYLPDLHSAAAERRYFAEQVFADCQVWLAEPDGIHGFCAFRPGWVDHLYIRPEWQRRGLGSALLAQAMTGQQWLHLRAFQRNVPALRFYAARGFREIARSDGSRNEEGEPDLLLEWRAVEAQA